MANRTRRQWQPLCAHAGMKMNLSKIQLEIDRAFNQVSPGNIGIREAQAQDDRGNDAELTAARLQDSEETWKDIPDEVLRNCPNAFTYLDKDGFKFLMPAVMHWSLRDNNFELDLSAFLFYNLVCETRKPEYKPIEIVKKYELTPPQISAVISWIEAFVALTGPSLASLETAQVERWKALI